jgi:hypothetical protein
MGMTKALVATFVCAALAGCGGKTDEAKKDEAPAPAPAPPPSAPTVGAPGAAGLGGLVGGGLAGLFGGAKKKEAPVKGLFGGGGLNLGALGGLAKAADGAARAGEPPAPPAAPPPPDPGKPSEGGPSCAAIAQHIAVLAKDEFADQPQAAAQVTAAIAQMCDGGGWPVEARQCILNAADEAALDKCGDMIPGGGVAGGDEATEPGGPAAPDVPDIDMSATGPVSSGNADCDAMAASFVPALIASQMAQMGQQVPPEAKQMLDQMKWPIQNQLAAVCAKSKWPREAIQCLGAARSEPDATTCVTKFKLAGG